MIKSDLYGDIEAQNQKMSSFEYQTSCEKVKLKNLFPKMKFCNPFARSYIQNNTKISYEFICNMIATTPLCEMEVVTIVTTC
jgi:hypothetical protein